MNTLLDIEEGVRKWTRKINVWNKKQTLVIYFKKIIYIPSIKKYLWSEQECICTAFLSL